MSRLTLEKAKEILKKHTTEDHLFTHAQYILETNLWAQQLL